MAYTPPRLSVDPPCDQEWRREMEADRETVRRLQAGADGLLEEALQEMRNEQEMARLLDEFLAGAG